jgi:hypothetical protein
LGFILFNPTLNIIARFISQGCANPDAWGYVILSLDKQTSMLHQPSGKYGKSKGKVMRHAISCTTFYVKLSDFMYKSTLSLGLIGTQKMSSVT